MKKTLLCVALAFIAIFTATQAFAQFSYNYSSLTQTYSPLTSSVSINKGSIWNSDTAFNIPIGFNFKLDGSAISSFYLMSGNYISATKIAARQSGFMVIGTGLMDRGQSAAFSKSEIRYQTTGTAGNRILKLEVNNAGFEDEFFNNGVLKDSISFQIWMYEGTNALEFHYGPSMVSNFSDYFGGLMHTGYIKNIDTATGTFDKFYVVNEKSGTKSIDSMNSFFEAKGLSSVPAKGMVFRFVPRSSASTAVAQMAAGSLGKIYPTQCNGMLNIEHSSSEPLKYTVLSIDGQVKAEGNASLAHTTIDLSLLAPGTYIVRLQDVKNNTYESQKFIRL